MASCIKFIWITYLKCTFKVFILCVKSISYRCAFMLMTGISMSDNRDVKASADVG